MNQQPIDREEILSILERANETDLSEEEAQRLEEVLSANPQLAKELLSPLPGEEVLGEESIAMPSDLEWKRIEKGIETATDSGRDDRTPEANSLEKQHLLRKEPSPTPSVLTTWIPLAAALILCAIVVTQIRHDGLGKTGEPPPVAEVIDLRDDAQPTIMNLPDEDGGVIIYVTSG